MTGCRIGESSWLRIRTTIGPAANQIRPSLQDEYDVGSVCRRNRPEIAVAILLVMGVSRTVLGPRESDLIHRTTSLRQGRLHSDQHLLSPGGRARSFHYRP